MKKFAFTGPMEGNVSEMKEEIGSIGQDITDLHDEIRILGSGLILSITNLYLLSGLVATILIYLFTPLDLAYGRSIWNLVWMFVVPIVIYFTMAISISFAGDFIESKRSNRKEDLNSRIKKLEVELANAKKAMRGTTAAPKLAEELDKMDVNIEELYSEIKHLIPFSEILEN